MLENTVEGYRTKGELFVTHILLALVLTVFELKNQDQCEDLEMVSVSSRTAYWTEAITPALRQGLAAPCLQSRNMRSRFPNSFPKKVAGNVHERGLWL